MGNGNDVTTNQESDNIIITLTEEQNQVNNALDLQTSQYVTDNFSGIDYTDANQNIDRKLAEQYETPMNQQEGTALRTKEHSDSNNASIYSVDSILSEYVK